MFKNNQKKVDTRPRFCESARTHRNHNTIHMRTKTILVTGLLVAAGITTSTAQAVYSVNIVGYINKSLPPGLSLISNQLNASPDNKVQTLFGSPAGQVTVYKFNATA